MSTQFLALLASLAAALSWGSGDFGGGVAARRLDSIRVVIGAQLFGALGLIVLTLVSGETMPSLPRIGAALAAGTAGGLGLLMFYQALAIGPMGVIAPLTAAISGIIPAAAGILLEGWPGGLRFSGFALALIAAWVIASPGDHRSPPPKALALSVLAGLGFAIFLTVVARLGASGPLWPLVWARLASISLLGLILLRQVSRENQKPHSASPIPWAFIALAGAGDTLGNVLFVTATRLGRLDVAAVVSSLYPAATVLLARIFLDERLSARQILGVVLALVAIALIAF